MNTLVLVVTRRCTQRCVYCPVAKNGWPDMRPSLAADALRWFVDRGGGTVKLFGGEPLLVPEVVRAVVDAAAREPRIQNVSLSSNGVSLDREWLDYLAARPKVRLSVSLDGLPEDHARVRPASGRPGAVDWIDARIPSLVAFPRLVVNQVLAPETASRAAAGFRYLLGRGFRRFNLMPASYVAWSSSELEALKSAFDEIAEVVRAEWRAGRRLYLRNMYVRNAQPVFTTAAVMDVNGEIFPSDCILADLPPEERGRLRCGTVDAPPDETRLAEHAAAVPSVLARFWPPEILRATTLADAALDRLWAGLIHDCVGQRRSPAPPDQSRVSSKIHWSVVSGPMGR